MVSVAFAAAAILLKFSGMVRIMAKNRQFPATGVPEQSFSAVARWLVYIVKIIHAARSIEEQLTVEKSLQSFSGNCMSRVATIGTL